MSDEPALKLYPQCEVCWIKENARWEPEGVSEEGKIVARLTAISIPLELTPGEIHICCECGEITIVGLFVEKYPYEVKHDVGPLDAEPLDEIT